MEVVALLVALSVAGTAVWRDVTRQPPAPLVVRELRDGAKLGLSRPAPFPTGAPLGEDAHDLPFDLWQQRRAYAVSVQLLIDAYREAEHGDPRRQCDIFDQIKEPDCHLASLFEKRNEVVAGKPYVVQTGGEGADAALGAQVMRTQLAKLKMDEILQHLGTHNEYGWACVEIDWGVVIMAGRSWILPTCLTPVRARRFRISSLQLDGVEDELRLYADITRPRGDALRPYKWIVIRRDRATPLAACGLMRNCAWPALAKRYAVGDWIKFSDRFGKPLPIATYNEDADDDAKDVAEEIVANIGNDIGAIKPNSIELEFKEAVGVDNSKTHGGLIAHANAEMSKRVNGATLSNDNAGSGGASYGLGAVHDDLRWEAVQYDAGRIESAFDTCLFAPFMFFNGLVAPTPQMKIQVVRDLDPTTRIDVAVKFRNLLGGKLSNAQMSQEFGFQEPTGPDDELPGAALPPVPEPTPTTKEQR